ncbi:MAG: helix-turn-helix domain-containing protein [Patescibacteria group bacterium]
MQDTLDLLRHLGCSDAEARVFVATVALPHGASVIEISRSLNLPRTTIYDHINALIGTGLMKKGRGDEGALFYAESPEHIEQLFDERVRRLLVSKKLVRTALHRPDTAPSAYRPKLFFYDQKNATELILRDILRSREKQMYWFWPMSDMVKTIPTDVFSDFHHERAKRGIRLNVLWPKNKVVDPGKYPELMIANTQSLRETRILPGTVNTLLGYGIYGNKVGFISTKNEAYGFILDSKELAQTLKSQFDYWWKLSRPL